PDRASARSLLLRAPGAARRWRLLLVVCAKDPRATGTPFLSRCRRRRVVADARRDDLSAPAAHRLAKADALVPRAAHGDSRGDARIARPAERVAPVWRRPFWLRPRSASGRRLAMWSQPEINRPWFGWLGSADTTAWFASPDPITSTSALCTFE